MQTWARLAPEFIVTDLSASLGFWCGLIGFSIAYERPDDGFAYLDLEGAQVMLEQRDEMARQWVPAPLAAPLGRGINVQIRVPSAAAIVERLERAGWPLFMAPEDKWYAAGPAERGQRQFLVQDPDGYLLRPFEDLGDRPARG